MLIKLDLSKKSGNSHIAILYPGYYLSDTDSGYYTIGRIDQAHIHAGAVVKMHPHVNDDILSYFRTGKVLHTDSEGFSEQITPNRLMLMKAGKRFYHEEAIQEELEGLQIFIRPKEKDATPEVTFMNLAATDSVNQWRLLASPDAGARLQLSSNTRIYDIKVLSGTTLELPESPQPGLAYLLYAFQGNITVNGTTELNKGESLLIRDEAIRFTTGTTAELVLFITDTTAVYYDGGMYSGNQR